MSNGRDVDEFSDSLSELSIFKSKNQGESSEEESASEQQDDCVSGSRLEDKKPITATTTTVEEEEDEDLKKIKEKFPGYSIVRMTASKRYCNPRHPETVEKDPQGKLLPRRRSGYNPFGILEAPPGITCEICDSPDHWRSVCPYLCDFPPNARVSNTDAYQVVCNCGNPDVNPPDQACRKCVSGMGFHAVRKPCPTVINPSYAASRDPARKTYNPQGNTINVHSMIPSP